MIQFDSWNSTYKTPFGAVECGTKTTFRILAEECDAVVLVTDSLGEFPMQRENDWFSVTVTPPAAGLVFYHFRLHSIYGPTFFCGKDVGGSSACTSETPQNYQLTVYEPTPPIPDWYKKGIVYQIFPDRFCVGSSGVRKTKPNAYYRAWDESPEYLRDANGGIEKWDFYGGNLQGVREKLPYLQDLGVTCIYLNPIFESASNHRYSTANFKKIDDVLGTEEDFKALIQDADAHGIKILLDGVFNHVGADSLYFNKFGHYDTVGAYQSAQSPYYPWFRFTQYPTEYECWWGVDDLPNLEESNADLRRFLLTDADSVIRHWTNLGIGGWRLDVADELPDDFLALLFQTVKSENSEAVVMGEVWEDASNKVAYNSLRKYFTHQELDCVMNYPFRDNLLAFFRYEISAFDLTIRFMTQMENYPKSAFLCNLNLLGTHDVERIQTITAEICPHNPLGLLEQLLALQFTFPGVPSVYYGDEAGVTGGKDPYNRKPYPWGHENKTVFNLYQKYMRLRANSPVLQEGETVFFAESADIFGVKRSLNGKSITVTVNRTAPSETQIKEE